MMSVLHEFVLKVLMARRLIYLSCEQRCSFLLFTELLIADVISYSQFEFKDSGFVQFSILP